MGKKLNIFISYRRADSTDFAGRLHDNLKREYNVFFDTEDGIGAGEKFLNVIVDEIEKADIFLMVVGGKRCLLYYYSCSNERCREHRVPTKRDRFCKRA